MVLRRIEIPFDIRLDRLHEVADLGLPIQRQSAYLDPEPGRPRPRSANRPISRAGAGAWMTPFSHDRQPYLGLMVTSTRNCARAALRIFEAKTTFATLSRA
jgi:hypothetical protein